LVPESFEGWIVYAKVLFAQKDIAGGLLALDTAPFYSDHQLITKCFIPGTIYTRTWSFPKGKGLKSTSTHSYLFPNQMQFDYCLGLPEQPGQLDEVFKRAVEQRLPQPNFRPGEGVTQVQRVELLELLKQNCLNKEKACYCEVAQNTVLADLTREIGFEAVHDVYVRMF